MGDPNALVKSEACTPSVNYQAVDRHCKCILNLDETQ